MLSAFGREDRGIKPLTAMLSGVFAFALVVGALTQSNPASAVAPSTAALGKKIFFDPSLSASGHMSCATCHSPLHAYGPPNGLAVQNGGANLEMQGVRSVPSLRYVLNRTPAWGKSYVASTAERVMEGNEPPAGGFGWDGRFKTLRAQAEFPLLALNEMANADPGDFVAKLQRASYANDFRKVFGADIFEDAQRAYAQALAAIEHFELEDASFHPYSSKYDDFLDGRAVLSAAELRGLGLFNDPQRGNCAACHLSAKGADSSHPLFTDYQFEALGVPRNTDILANAAPNYFDEGLCGPIRTDQAKQVEYCGMFKTPTLRNVAARRVFFHNGRFHTLKEALRFYVRRDTDPQLWYPESSSGAIDKFDDSPVNHRDNIDVIDLPLTRKQGEAPAWNDAEIDDVIAFLETLTDRDAR